MARRLKRPPPLTLLTFVPGKVRVKRRKREKGMWRKYVFKKIILIIVIIIWNSTILYWLVIYAIKIYHKMAEN